MFRRTPFPERFYFWHIVHAPKDGLTPTNHLIWIFFFRKKHGLKKRAFLLFVSNITSQHKVKIAMWYLYWKKLIFSETCLGLFFECLSHSAEIQKYYHMHAVFLYDNRINEYTLKTMIIFSDMNLFLKMY